MLRALVVVLLRDVFPADDESPMKLNFGYKPKYSIAKASSKPGSQSSHVEIFVVYIEGLI
jgi:hypothetical protein